MDELATNLLATLKRSSVSADVKVTQFNGLKSQIKHQRVPESAQSAIVECVRLAIIAQTSTTLVQAGFSALGHLVKRLTIQDQVAVLFAPRHNLLQALLERLGDPKEGYRAAAAQALGELWPARQVDVEKVVREGAIQGSHARAKEAGMQWVAKMHAEHSLQFRNFVPPMIECLEDADGQVREAAKTNIIELFGTARDAAKQDLKRQLVAFNVRKSIAAHILTTLQVPNASDFATSVAQHSVSHASTTRPETPAQENFAQSTALDSSHPPATDTAPVEPLYISTPRELEDLFRAMHPAFEDRESEDNWKIRDSNVLKIRRILRGNAPQEFMSALLAGIKDLLDGILKVVNSLRTTMSTMGCQLVQDLANILGTAIDPMVEILLRGLEKMSAATKHIAAQNANVTVDTILLRVSYHARLMQHILLASGDKNVQPRQFASGWLKTILRKQVQNKGQFEHSGGLDLAEKTIKKGLNDANPKVRENMRSAYWMFTQAWPDKGESIMASLDAKSRQLLQKDSSNPNAGSTASASAFTVSVGPAAAPNVRAAGSRQSLKETIAAQRKASLVAKQAPSRPTSAMSTFSPVREAPTSVSRPAPSASAPGRGRPVAPSAATTTAPQRPPAVTVASALGSSTLSSAPMRRPRRPDMPRPATADLYSNRQKLKADTPPRSPVPSPPRQFRASNLGGPNGRPDSAASTREGSGRTSRNDSPRISPVRSKSRPPPARATMNGKGGNGPLSPLGAGSEDNFTMIFPPAVSAVNGPEQSTIPQQPVSSTTSEESQPASFADEDNFTLVIPIRGMSNTSLPPLNTQVDVLPTIIDEPTKTMTMTVPVMQPITTNGLIDDFELIPTDTTPTITMTSPMQEAQLIVFEDTSAEDLIVPQSGTSPTRAALEELHPSEQNQVIASTEEPLEEKSTAPAGPRTRSVSPVKRSKITPNLDAAQDRAEVLKTRRLFASGVERIKAHTLDIHGFRKVQELIKTNPQNPDLKYNDLLAALLDFLKSEDDDTKVNNVKAQALKSQTLTTLRLLQSQGLSYQGMQAALLSVLVASGQCTKNSHLALDLERTADGIVSQGKQDCLNMLQAVLSFAENIGWNDKILLVSCFRVLGKLFIVIREKQDQLDMQVVQRLGKVSRRCFGDLDADVRRAVTQCCLEWHAAMGQENEQLFWRTLNGISEAQLNLLAYYMARRGAAVAAAS